MRPQTRTRKMRQPGRHTGRKTDGNPRVYYGPARDTARRATRTTEDQERSS